MKIRRIVMLLSVIVLLVLPMGCKRKGVDYLNEKEQFSTNTESELAKRLGIPKAYGADIDPGNSRLCSITIKDDDIMVPAADSMQVVYVEENKMDAAYKKEVAQALLHNTDEIYIYDEDVWTKKDYEIEMQMTQFLIENYKKAGNMEYADYYEDLYAQYQRAYEAADEGKTVSNWNESDYIGYRDELPYQLEFKPNSDGTLGYFMFYMPYIHESVLYRPCESAIQADLSWASGMDIGSNECECSQEEAIDLAQEYLNDCGITDVAVELICDLEWQYFNPDGSKTTKVDGYFIRFIRTIDGTPIYNGHMPEGIFKSGEMVYEQCEVYIDENGILDATVYDMFRPTGKTEKNVELLSWQEILDIVEMKIPEYYAEHPTDYESVTFNDVRLTYFIVRDDENDGFRYIPVWVFAESEEYIEGASDFPTQLIMIDAVTGELIDVGEQELQNKKTIGRVTRS